MGWQDHIGPACNSTYGGSFRLNDEPHRRLCHAPHSSSQSSKVWMNARYLDFRVQFFVGNLRRVDGIFSRYAPKRFYYGAMPRSRGTRTAFKDLPPNKDVFPRYKGARTSSPDPTRVRSNWLYPGFPLPSIRCYVDVTCGCHSDPRFICEAPCAQAYEEKDRDPNGGICLMHWQRLYGQSTAVPKPPHIPEPQSGTGSAGRMSSALQESPSVCSNSLGESESPESTPESIREYGRQLRAMRESGEVPQLIPYLPARHPRSSVSENSCPATPTRPSESFTRSFRGEMTDTPPSWTSSEVSNPESVATTSPDENHVAGVLAQLVFTAPPEGATLRHDHPSEDATPVPTAAPAAPAGGSTPYVAERDQTPPPTVAMARNTDSPPTPSMPTMTDFAIAQTALALWNAGLSPNKRCPDLGMTWYDTDVTFTTPHDVCIRPWPEVYRILEGLWKNRASLPVPDILKSEPVISGDAGVATAPDLGVGGGLPAQGPSTSVEEHPITTPAEQPPASVLAVQASRSVPTSETSSLPSSLRQAMSDAAVTAPSDGSVRSKVVPNTTDYYAPRRTRGRARSRSALHTDAPTPPLAPDAPPQQNGGTRSRTDAPCITRIPTDYARGETGHRPGKVKVEKVSSTPLKDCKIPSRVVKILSPLRWPIFELESPKQKLPEKKTPAPAPMGLQNGIARSWSGLVLLPEEGVFIVCITYERFIY